MGKSTRKLCWLAVLMFVFVILFSNIGNAKESGISKEKMNIGGGYAASDQLENMGYYAQMYDAKNGLPTSEANFVLGTDEGYIWIGGYSGIIRYDGSNFYRFDSTDGLTSARALFEDS